MKLMITLALACFHLSLFFTSPLSADGNSPQENKQTIEQKQQPVPGRDAPIWDKNKNQENAMAPAIKKLKDGILQIGNIMVNKNEGSVLVQGQVNMQEGLVEYLACGVYGKLHESVLKLYSEPFHIQIALLLLGLEPGEKHLGRQGAHGIPEGDPIDILVSWFDDQKTITHRAEELLLNTKTGQTMEKTHWIFTGSQIVKGKFMAQVEHSIASTYHDPYAIIDHPLKTGTDDTLYVANNKILPPKGTTINFLIKLIKKE
ncbi:MAG: YdjY domain-containing protein [Pseudomonadota bacterium]